MKKALLIGAALAVSLSSTASRAQGAGNDSERSLALRKEAIAAADKSDWATCVSKGREAWALQKSPLTAGALGICEAAAGDDVEAAEHLDYALRLDDVAARRDMVGKKLDEVKKRVAGVVVKTHPEGCHVEVAGAARPTDGTTIYVTPGRIQIVATKAGFEPKTIDVEVAAGANVPITIELVAQERGGVGGGKRPVWPAIVGYGLGIAGLAAGVGTLVAANGTDVAPGCTTKCEDASDKQNTLSNASVGTFVAGGVLMAASTGYLIWAVSGHHADSTVTTTGIRWTPVVGPSVQGLMLQGRF